MAKVFILFLIVSLPLFGQDVKVASGVVVRHAAFPSLYVQERNVDIWLPEGYNASKKYTVLYMNDGQMLFDSTTTWNGQEWKVDETMSQLISEKKIKECIVVGVWNGGPKRHVEYFPQKPFESLPEKKQDSIYQVLESLGRNSGDLQIQSDKYLCFLVKELKPFIDANYHTLKGPENTFIAGSSMGGLISMYALCEYPQVFGGAACISTHWPGLFTAENNPVPSAFFSYLEANLPNPTTHKIYFDYGTATLDALYAPFQEEVDEIMLQKGFTKNNWVTLRFEGEEHSEKAWAKRLHIPLVFLLPKQ